MKDIYENALNSILEQMEKGVIPWKMPWKTLSIFPTNFFTSKVYRGINIFLLGGTALKKGYDCPYWGGFKQINNAGGLVKKGEKATDILRVVYFDNEDPEKPKKDEDDKIDSLPKKNTKRPFIFSLRVFNLEQTEGINYLPELKKVIDEHQFKVPQELFDSYVSLNGIGFEHNGYGAFYDDTLDRISIPELAQYPNPNDYWQTSFHEAAHSTGIPKRLNRKCFINYKSERGDRSEEELVAEIASSFLMTECGLDFDVPNTTAYIDGWSSFLKEQRKSLIIKASNMADSAVRFILGKTEEYSKDVSETAA